MSALADRIAARTPCRSALGRTPCLELGGTQHPTDTTGEPVHRNAALHWRDDAPRWLDHIQAREYPTRGAA